MPSIITEMSAVVFIPTDDVSGQTGLIVLGLEGAGRYACSSQVRLR